MNDSVSALAGLITPGSAKDAGVAGLADGDDQSSKPQPPTSPPTIPSMIEVWFQPQFVAAGTRDGSAATSQSSSDDPGDNPVHALSGQVVAVMSNGALQLAMPAPQATVAVSGRDAMPSRAAPLSSLARLPLPVSTDMPAPDLEASVSSATSDAKTDATTSVSSANTVAELLQSVQQGPSRADSGNDTAVVQATPIAQPQGTMLPVAPIAMAAIARQEGVSTPATSANKAQGLAQVLGERLHVQLGSGVEHATIRLDPPMKGTIEIIVRREDGAVQVHLRASDGEVARQLQSIGDALKQDLVQRQHAAVSVQVSDGSRDADGRQRQRHSATEQDPGRALSDGGEASETTRFVLAQTRSETT
jgi:flagellar hook-length control protein FliK